MEMTQDTIMNMMNNQLEMLQVEFDDALKDLGKVSRNKNFFWNLISLNFNKVQTFIIYFW